MTVINYLEIYWFDCRLSLFMASYRVISRTICIPHTNWKMPIMGEKKRKIFYVLWYRYSCGCRLFSKKRGLYQLLLLLWLNSKVWGSISSSNFDEQLSDILVTCLSPIFSIFLYSSVFSCFLDLRIVVLVKSKWLLRRILKLLLQIELLYLIDFIPNERLWIGGCFDIHIKTLSFDTSSFMPYGNVQSKDIMYNEKVTVY